MAVWFVFFILVPGCSRWSVVQERSSSASKGPMGTGAGGWGSFALRLSTAWAHGHWSLKTRGFGQLSGSQLNRSNQSSIVDGRHLSTTTHRDESQMASSTVSADPLTVTNHFLLHCLPFLEMKKTSTCQRKFHWIETQTSSDSTRKNRLPLV